MSSIMIKIILVSKISKTSIITFSYGKGPFKGNFKVLGSRFQTFKEPEWPTTGTNDECPVMETIFANGRKVLTNVVNSSPNTLNRNLN